MTHNNFMHHLFVVLAGLLVFSAFAGHETKSQREAREAREGKERRQSRSPQSRGSSNRPVSRRTPSSGDDEVPAVIAQAQEQQARLSNSQPAASLAQPEPAAHSRSHPASVKLNTHRKSTSPVLASMGQSRSAPAGFALDRQTSTEFVVASALVQTQTSAAQVFDEQEGKEPPSSPRSSAVTNNYVTKKKYVLCTLL